MLSVLYFFQIIIFPLPIHLGDRDMGDMSDQGRVIAGPSGNIERVLKNYADVLFHSCQYRLLIKKRRIN